MYILMENKNLKTVAIKRNTQKKLKRVSDTEKKIIQTNSEMETELETTPRTQGRGRAAASI